MILGCRGWNDVTGYFRQNNGPVENFLEAYGVKQFYAICYPSSVCRAIAAVRNEKNLWVKSSGGEYMQPEDALTMYMNDPSYRVALNKIRNDPDVVLLPENQVPQYYPYMVRCVFNEEIIFEWGNAEKVKDLVMEENAVVVIKDEIHAVCFVAYDVKTKEMIYDDPLYGFNLRIPFDDVKDHFGLALLVAYKEG